MVKHITIDKQTYWYGFTNFLFIQKTRVSLSASSVCLVFIGQTGDALLEYINTFAKSY